MLEQLALCFAKLGPYLGGHMLLSLTALAVGLAVSLPLGIYAARRPRFAEVALGVAGVIQTIPSLALLALMVPLLGGMIGFWPAFIALTLYSILPALSNTITGLRGVDPTLVEAARGLGMDDRQILWRVQLPLAAPVIIAGIRTATVLVVGTATLVTPVGGTSLGNYIFSGLNTGNQVGVVFGCIATALLAVTLDQLIRLLEVSARTRSQSRAMFAAACLLLLAGGGLYDPVSQAMGPRIDRLTVGNLEFTEQHILGDLLGDWLQGAGIPTKADAGLAENLQFQALCDGHVDVCVEYTGNIWSRELKRKDFANRETTYETIKNELLDKYGVTCLGRLGFENAYALAVTEDAARKHNLTTVADLAPHARRWEVAGDDQIFHRPEWERVQSNYKLNFAKQRSMLPSFMYDAAVNGKSQVICAYTSDGRIRANNLRLLADPEGAFPPYDAVLLLSRRAAAKPDVVAALQPLLGAVDLPRMQAANGRVDMEHWPVRRAAVELRDSIRAGKP